MDSLDCRRAFDYGLLEERTPEQEHFLREHLASCPVCRREAAEWAWLRTLAA